MPNSQEDDLAAGDVVPQAVHTDSQPVTAGASTMELPDRRWWTERVGFERRQTRQDPRLYGFGQLVEVPEEAGGQADRKSVGHGSIHLVLDSILEVIG